MPEKDAPFGTPEEVADALGEDAQEVRETTIEILRHHEPELASEVKRGGLNE